MTSAPRTVFVNATLIDPDAGTETIGGLLVEDGVIAAVGKNVTADTVGSAKVIEAAGRCLSPGLIDARVFTGEPGAEHRETLATAGNAAAAGGVTTMILMPDTDPVIDDIALVDFLLRRAQATSKVKVATTAALSKGLSGTEMTELRLLADAGAVAFTDGRKTVSDALFFRRVMTYARDFGGLIMNHVQEPSLAGQGVMNEGEFASRLGLRGIPMEAETIQLDRDLSLTNLTGGRYHAAMISCRGSIERVAQAKNDGISVTCGVSVNHLTLNEADVGQYRTFCKLSPPLRTEDERLATIDAVRDGLIDLIVSSHDPQDVEDKRRPFEEANYGAVGVETMLPALLRLYHAGHMGLAALLKPLTANPASMFGFESGRLKKGAPADLCLFDPNETWTLERDMLKSRAKNTPFDEADFKGRVHMTLVDGHVVFDAAAA
ncbi:MAG: dihydroorotase [Pseudomonadota bacterium]